MKSSLQSVFIVVIVFLAVFLSSCISNTSEDANTSAGDVQAVIKQTPSPVRDASTSASISIETSAEKYTIYVPVLLDENKNVLKMYETPAIRGNSSNVTTTIIDTEYGKALKISRSGLDYFFNWNDVPGNDTGRFIKWLEYRGFTEQGDKLDIRKTDNGSTLTAYVSRVGYNGIEYTYRINEKKVLESTIPEFGLFFAKEENGKLNIYSGDIEINMNEKHVFSKEYTQPSSISMSNYTSSEPFINMINPGFRPEIDAWVYSDSEIDRFYVYYSVITYNRNNQEGLLIGTQRVHLIKGWQVVKISGGMVVT